MSSLNPFYFLRHGETHWNVDKIVQGQFDSQLNDNGREQAKVAGEVLRGEPIERIICSPLSRTKHTAEAVAKHHNLEIVFDDDLMECNLGDHQGDPHGDWIPDYWKGKYAPPNGETFQQFRERTWNAMQRAIALGPNTLIVAHGGLWLAAQEYVSVDPAMRLINNALPIAVTPSSGTWKYQVLGGQ